MTNLLANGVLSVQMILSACMVESTNATERPASFPDDPRPAVQLLYKLASAAKLFNFDPTVTGYRESTNRLGKVIVFETPTHISKVINGKLIKVVSKFDGSNPPHDRSNEGLKTWYQCTAEYPEEQAIKDTFEILRKTKDEATLNAVLAGRHEFRASSITVRNPTGEKVKVAPFPTVRLYDAEGILRVKAEYRVGPTGVVGITDWFNNR